MSFILNKVGKELMGKMPARRMMQVGCFICAGLAVFYVSDAVAAGGHGEAGAHAPSIYDLRWFWLNFVLYVGGLWWLLRAKVGAGWITRRESIAKEVADRRGELKAAAEARQIAELKLAAVAQEVTELTTTIQAETKNEKQQIVAEAELRAQRVLRQAEGTLAAELKAGEAAVQQKLADVVMRRAEELVRKNVNLENDRQKRGSVVNGIKALIQAQ